jgi:hypothetical protein
MGTPRLPWKRGPAAWKVAIAADEILNNLEASHRGFYSLRRAARLLGVSTQPVRDWIQRHYLKRDGPRGKLSKAELCRFVGWLKERAEPFDSRGYLDRLHPKGRPRAWDKLRAARFAWPRGCRALTPKELAQLAGCHPSLIVKAISRYRDFNALRGHRRTPCRWEITKRSWAQAFPSTLVESRS